MKKRQNKSIRASALQITLSLALISLFAVLVAIAAPSNPLGVQPQGSNPPPTLGNYPNTSLPLSTDTTVTPDAVPTNTSSMNVSTSTDFKGTLEGYPATGVVRVIDARPAGIYMVTVHAFGPMDTSTTRTFILTVTSSACTQFSLAPASNISLPHGGYRQVLVVNDYPFPGIDGGVLIIGTDFSDHYESWAVPSGGGGLFHYQDIPDPPHGIMVHHSTIDGPPGEGFLQVQGGPSNGLEWYAVDNSPSQTNPFLWQLLQLSPGYAGCGGDPIAAEGEDAVANYLAHSVFVNGSQFDTGINPRSIALGGFGGYGGVAVTSEELNEVLFFLDNGGWGAPPTIYPVGDRPVSVVMGDFNHDGQTDLAVANFGSNNVSILLGLGGGAFGPAVNYPVGVNPISILVGRFNSDDKDDLAVANFGSNNVSILLADGLGGFSAPTDLPVASSPMSLTVGYFGGASQDLVVGEVDHFSTVPSNGDGTFGPATNYDQPSGGYHASSVAVGDFNGDGKQDLLTNGLFSIAPGHGSLNVLLGDGLGTFNELGITRPGPGSSQIRNVAVGDFNGDGKEDVALTTGSSNSVSIWLGDGAGSFSYATAPGVNGVADSVAVGDFNGDGKQDLAVASDLGTDTVSILLGDGTGSFSPATTFATGSDPQSVVVGDFNGDGKQDLVFALSTNLVSILLGDGAGGFSEPAFFSVGGAAAAVALGDFNGDGKQDLAVAGGSSDDVVILLGDGSGGFGAPASFSVGTNPVRIVVADFNGDGNQDLAVSNHESNNVTILLGDGTGGFDAPINLDVGTNPFGLVVGDFNGDGKQDLAVANEGSNTVSILLNNCTTPTPTPPPTPTPVITPTPAPTASPTPAPTASPTQTPGPTASPGTCTVGKNGDMEFQGHSSTSGPAGNIRTFTKDNVTIKVSAFNRTAGGVWTTSYLGLYDHGLGVTSNGENPATDYRVDNGGGSVDYVLFEINNTMGANEFHIEEILADSDLRFWIGTQPNPINNHNTLSDAVLTTLGPSEDNFGDDHDHEAHLNGGDPPSGPIRTGNVLVVAALPGDTNDSFLLRKLEWDCPPRCPQIQVNPDHLDNATVGQQYQKDVQGDHGQNPYTLTVSSGSLPPGLTLNSAQHKILGTPTTPGTYTFTITATDANGCMGSRSYTIVVSCSDIQINPGNLANGKKNQSYNQNIQADHGVAPYTFMVSSGSLPPGLMLSPGNDNHTVILSGTPTTLGTYTFTIKATDAYGCTGTKSYAITVTN